MNDLRKLSFLDGLSRPGFCFLNFWMIWVFLVLTCFVGNCSYTAMSDNGKCSLILIAFELFS